MLRTRRLTKTLEGEVSSRRLGYLAIAAFGFLSMLLIGYELYASLLNEGTAVYDSPKHGVVARGIPAIFMHVSMLALGFLFTAYGIRGALRK